MFKYIQNHLLQNGLPALVATKAALYIASKHDEMDSENKDNWLDELLADTVRLYEMDSEPMAFLAILEEKLV